EDGWGGEVGGVGVEGLVGYGVVGRCYIYPLLLNTGRDRFSDCGNSSPNLLEVSKTTRRLGQAQMARPGSGQPACVDRFDRLAYFFKEIHIQPLRCNTNDEPSDCRILTRGFYSDR